VLAFTEQSCRSGHRLKFGYVYCIRREGAAQEFSHFGFSGHASGNRTAQRFLFALRSSTDGYPRLRRTDSIPCMMMSWPGPNQLIQAISSGPHATALRSMMQECEALPWLLSALLINHHSLPAIVANISELFRSTDKPPFAELAFFVGC
jgi:hypothetical protein